MPSKQPSGARPKHIPQRMCIACRQTDAKRGLVRIVRDSQGGVRVDPSGKQPGRGAYLCQRRACWDQALKRHMLTRALNISELSAADRAELETYAAALPDTRDSA